jgi:Rrf2 family protein
MLHFNKKTEYALLALEMMAKNPEVKATARNIAEAHKIPYPVMAKVMQKMSGKGLIKSVQGTKGGYILAKKPGEISVENIVHIFEGPVAVAECFKEEKISCPQWDGCIIKGPFSELNRKIHALLAQTTVGGLVAKVDSANQLPTFSKEPA